MNQLNKIISICRILINRLKEIPSQIKQNYRLYIIGFILVDFTFMLFSYYFWEEAFMKVGVWNIWLGILTVVIAGLEISSDSDSYSYEEDDEVNYGATTKEEARHRIEELGMQPDLGNQYEKEYIQEKEWDDMYKN